MQNILLIADTKLIAIDLYNKTIENLMNINKDDKNCKAEFLPSMADMISYTQENRYLNHDYCPYLCNSAIISQGLKFY